MKFLLQNFDDLIRTNKMSAQHFSHRNLIFSESVNFVIVHLCRLSVNQFQARPCDLQAKLERIENFLKTFLVGPAIQSAQCNVSILVTMGLGLSDQPMELEYLGMPYPQINTII